tara:strand:+ start:61 stop:387 length:327 start_codon:yes stop_codon:yes gene_type:complete
MKSFKQFKEAAIAVPLIGAGAKTLLKIGGAYAAAKGGEKLLKDLLGTKDDPKPMRDVYNKDLTKNARFDNKLDPTGEQKKPSLGKLRQGAKIRKQQKRREIKNQIKDK